MKKFIKWFWISAGVAGVIGWIIAIPALVLPVMSTALEKTVIVGVCGLGAALSLFTLINNWKK